MILQIHGFKKKIFLIIIFLSISAITIEASAQIWWFQIENCEYEKSNIYENVNVEMKKQVCLESFQFKNSDLIKKSNQNLINLEKPENTYKIFVLGGSSSIVSTNPDFVTIPEFLQNKFDMLELEIDVEIINAGITGGWSKPESNLIKTRLLQLHPDLFIIYDGHTDASSHAGWTEPQNLDVDWNKNDDNSKEMIQNWIDRWKEICLLGKKKNFDTVVIIQPMIGSSDRKISQNEQPYYLEIKQQQYLKRLGFFANALTELNSSCTDTGDFRNSFDGVNKQIYVADKGRVGEFGNKIISDKIFEKILPIINKTHSETVKISTSEINTEPQLVNNDSQVTKKLVLKYYKTPLMLFHFFDFNQTVISPDIRDDEIDRENLTNVNFKNSVFDNIDLSNSNLRNAVFSYSYIRDSNLSYSNLISADFSHAQLIGVRLNDSNLEKASFSNSDLFYSNFRNSNLSNADLSSINAIRGVDFQGANMSGSDLSGNDLRRNFFMDSDLSFANLKSSFINSRYLADANLIGADFTNAVLMDGGDLSNANLTDANFSNASLLKNNLSNSILTGVNFTNSVLIQTDFKNSNLEDAYGAPYIGCLNHPLCEN